MRDFRDAKAMARRLREALAEKDLALSHAECLELTARSFGLKDWHVLSAMIEAGAPTPAAPPGAGTWSGPLVLLRDFIVFPKATAPIFVGRETTKRALAEAYAGEQEVLLVAQKDAGDDDPGPDDIYSLGVIADVLDRNALPDGTMKLRVRGRQRARVCWVAEEDGVRRAQAALVHGEPADLAASRDTVRAALDAVGVYARIRTNIATSETGERLAEIGQDIAHPGVLADLIAAISTASVAEKQAVLEALDPSRRLQAAVGLISASKAKAASTWPQRPAP